MTTVRDVESIAAEIAELPKSQGPARDAATVLPGRLHVAKAPDGRLELFIEGSRESFGHAAVGRALEFGEYQELSRGRTFTALLVRSSAAESNVRAMAHVAYEALSALSVEPKLSNEHLLEILGPYLGLVLERDLLSMEQQLGMAGELMLLLELMNRAEELGRDAGVAVRSWTGWDSASRDFRGEGVAIECKVTRSPGRNHWVHPMYQLLSAPGEVERVYVFSVGINVDRSRGYRLLTAIDRVLERLSGPSKADLLLGLSRYAGVGYDGSHRRQYELEPGLLVTQPPALIRVDHLNDVLRPESFGAGALPERVTDLRYAVNLDGLPSVPASERLEVLDRLLAGADG